MYVHLVRAFCPCVPPVQPQASAVDDSTFPSWKQRNVQLAQSIEDLLDGDKPSVNELKRSAGAFRFACSCAKRSMTGNPLQR